MTPKLTSLVFFLMASFEMFSLCSLFHFAFFIFLFLRCSSVTKHEFCLSIVLCVFLFEGRILCLCMLFGGSICILFLDFWVFKRYYMLNRINNCFLPCGCSLKWLN